MLTLRMPALKCTGVAMQAHAAGSGFELSCTIVAAIADGRIAPEAMTRKASVRQSTTRDASPARATNRSSIGDRCGPSDLRAAKRK
jgi:hypothetical protein